MNEEFFKIIKEKRKINEYIEKIMFKLYFPKKGKLNIF